MTYKKYLHTKNHFSKILSSKNKILLTKITFQSRLIVKQKVIPQIFEMIIMSTTPRSVPLMDIVPSFNVFVSFKMSGKTVTSAMLMKPPLVKGIIQDVNESTATNESRTSANMAPDMPRDAVQNCALAASTLEKPDLINMAKSPTSCGIS